MKQILFIISLVTFFAFNPFSSQAEENHFSTPKNQPSWCKYSGKLKFYDTVSIDNEDEIGVFVKDFEKNEICIGSCIVGTILPNYFIVTVYGDDPVTKDIKEGAFDHEQLIFKAWDKSERQEYTIQIISAKSFTGMDLPSIPPIFEEKKNFAELHLNAKIPGDFNENIHLDLGDAIEILTNLSRD